MHARRNYYGSARHGEARYQGRPMAVDMRTTTITGARGTAFTTAEGECMTIDMCAATIKGARGAARM